MTRLHEEIAGLTVDHPNRIGLRNFTWTIEAIEDWEQIWHSLWGLGYKWEWQNHDRYVRRKGDEYVKFAVHDDAYRLDMALPLPQIHVIEEAQEHLMDHQSDDPAIDYTVAAIARFLKTHYTRET